MPDPVNWKITDSMLARAREPMRRDPRTGKPRTAGVLSQRDVDRANEASRAELVFGRPRAPDLPIPPGGNRRNAS